MEFAIFSLLLHVLHTEVLEKHLLTVDNKRRPSGIMLHTSEKIFTNHREAHVDASADRTVFLTLK